MRFRWNDEDYLLWGPWWSIRAQRKLSKTSVNGQNLETNLFRNFLAGFGGFWRGHSRNIVIVSFFVPSFRTFFPCALWMASISDHMGPPTALSLRWRGLTKPQSMSRQNQTGPKRSRLSWCLLTLPPSRICERARKLWGPSNAKGSRVFHLCVWTDRAIERHVCEKW